MAVVVAAASSLSRWAPTIVAETDVVDVVRMLTKTVDVVARLIVVAFEGDDRTRLEINEI